MNFILGSTAFLLCLSLFAMEPVFAVDSDDEADDEGTSTSTPQVRRPTVHSDTTTPEQRAKYEIFLRENGLDRYNWERTVDKAWENFGPR